MTTITVHPAMQIVVCARCEQPIAQWTGHSLVLQRTRAQQKLYFEFPTDSGVVKCHHSRRVAGRWKPCSYLNHIVAGVAS